MEQDEFEKKLTNATARGIAEEKTRESLAVFKVIGTVLLSWAIGAATSSTLVGVGVMLALFIVIWRGYRR